MPLPHDKKLHLVAGAAISWLVGIGALALSLPLWLAPIAAAFAGLCKEIWDLAGHGDPDEWDLVATAAGGALSWGIMALIAGGAA